MFLDHIAMVTEELKKLINLRLVFLGLYFTSTWIYDSAEPADRHVLAFKMNSASFLPEITTISEVSGD